MVTMTTGGRPRKQKTKDEQITELKELCSLIEQDNIKLREQVKNLTIPHVSKSVCSCIGCIEIHRINDKFICGTCNRPLAQH